MELTTALGSILGTCTIEMFVKFPLSNLGTTEEDKLDGIQLILEEVPQHRCGGGSGG